MQPISFIQTTKMKPLGFRNEKTPFRITKREFAKLLVRLVRNLRLFSNTIVTA